LGATGCTIYTVVQFDHYDLIPESFFIRKTLGRTQGNADFLTRRLCYPLSLLSGAGDDKAAHFFLGCSQLTERSGLPVSVGLLAAVVAIGLLAALITLPDWIEKITGGMPDGGNSGFEWALALAAIFAFWRLCLQRPSE
jgi:hypothetical protein